MTNDGLGRAYPYRSGWHVVGCAVVFFGLVGGIGVSLFPAGYDKFRAGQLPTGIALMVIGVFGLPTLGMAAWSLFGGVRDALRPPLLRVTATALILPANARGEPPVDADGEPLSADPPHPEEIPLAAVRRVARSGPRFNGTLEIDHDLSATPLRLAQHMMRAADFDDLERVLRAAVPAAFAR
jgi:hypothetical protein